MNLLQRGGGLLLACCTVAAAAIWLLVWPRLFESTPPGTGKLVAAVCAGQSDPGCQVKLLELSRGRYWVETSTSGADHVAFDFELQPGDEPARAVLLPAHTDHLDVTVLHADTAGAWAAVRAQRVTGGFRRGLLRLDQPVSGRLRIVVQRTGAGSERLRIEEIGLFGSDRGLLRDPRGFLRSQPDRRVYYGILGRCCLWLAVLGVAAVALLPPAAGRRYAPLFVLFLTLAAATLELWLVYNPYWLQSRDLRIALASGPLQEGVGSNLNYGMYLGSRLLQGEGLTFGPRWVPWERTPGYGFFVALAGLMAGYKTDLLTIGLYSIRLHLLFLAAANALFVWSAARVMRPAVALAAAAVIVFMPNQLANTQVDSIMVPVYLVTAAALCRYLDRSRGGLLPPRRDHLFVHASFALWFLMRPDGAVGWAAVSLLLYWRRQAWRYLVIPAATLLAIGISWGAYKYRYTGEFSMTTNTVGDNAWIGLWQVPHKFRWQTKDESYFAWAAAVGVPPTSKAANDRALREVGHFAATYPVYALHLPLHRLLEFVDQNVLLGTLSYPHVVYERMRGRVVFGLMTVIALCLVLPHERRRTLLLAWPLLFNLPLFLLFFSDGMRHVAPVSASIFATTLPCLFEPDLYRALWRRRVLAIGVVTTLLLAWLGARWLDRALLASDAWRYWTPFLDPAPFAWYLR